MVSSFLRYFWYFLSLKPSGPPNIIWSGRMDEMTEWSPIAMRCAISCQSSGSVISELRRP